MRYVVALLVSTIVATTAMAQTAFSADLDESASTLRAIMAKTERIQPTHYELSLSIQTDAQALLEKLIGISGRSSRVNLTMMKQGSMPDRELGLTTSTADALILALNLNLRYLDTKDKIFWSQALIAVSIAKSLRIAIGKQ